MYLGAGEGKTKIKGVATGERHGRLRKVMTVSNPSIGRATTAEALANNEVKYHTGLPNVGDFTLVDHPNAPIGSFGVGDMVYVQSGSEWFEGGDTWVRIASITYVMDESDQVSIVALKEGIE